MTVWLPRVVPSLLAVLVVAACSHASRDRVAEYPRVPPTKLVRDPGDRAGSPATVANPAALAAPAAGQSLAEWTASWPEGPASVLATRAEIEAYRSLGTPDERSAFIRGFWQHRMDPVPGGVRDPVGVLAERVGNTDRLFGRAAQPDAGEGWSTVFGRVMAVLGTPATVEESSLRSGARTDPAESLWARQGDRVLWQYGSPATGASSYFVEFGYTVDGWTVRCGDGWVADAGVLADPSGASVVRSPVSPNTSDRSLGNPFASNGTVASSGYSDGTPPRHVPRIGPGCQELLARGRAAWMRSPRP